MPPGLPYSSGRLARRGVGGAVRESDGEGTKFEIENPEREGDQEGWRNQASGKPNGAERPRPKDASGGRLLWSLKQGPDGTCTIARGLKR